MSELLQFMYQGHVNVKQSELQVFMTIAETLQIKGLATSNQNHNDDSQQQTMKNSADSNYNQFNQNNSVNNNGRSQHQNHYNSVMGNHVENHRQTTSTPLSSSSSVDNHSMKGKKMTWIIKS